uniref:Uncharacterized protein n=1 Tax=Nicotiana tabacum TaxID=4097 RepID=A0A1S3Y2C5_TOBAC|nr:PREDICTED: uncharacterized protein LOC107771443 [Nicotiana tabacum]
MEENSSVNQEASPDNADSTMTGRESTGNTHYYVEISMEPQEKKAIENMLSIAGEGVYVEEEPQAIIDGRELVPFETSAQDDTNVVPNDGPDPSTEDPGQGSSPQVSIDPASSPHFYDEPLFMVVREMWCDSEEDLEDLVIASFIRARSKLFATPEPTPKRPTIRFQKKEALESALKKINGVKEGESW